MKTSLIEKDVLGLLGFLVAVILLLGVSTPGFMRTDTFASIAFQLPELGLLTLAMLMPLISGGFNLASTFIANIAGLAMAWVIQSMGGVDAGVGAFVAGFVVALLVGALAGSAIGVIVAITEVHPILASLSVMIFLRGLGEFLTRGGDISGFPEFVGHIGHGSFLMIPIPLWIFIGCALIWHVLMSRTRLGFATRMVGSNQEATGYCGIRTRKTLILIYTLSGLMCAVAGALMLSRFNSVRVGHGESYLLITVLACFMGRVDPFGGFGRVLPVALALVILQVIASGLNIMGVSPHLSTAIWGVFLVLVMLLRWLWAQEFIQHLLLKNKYN